ncbi:CarD family transcriptional regulator [bacterium]|nr:CarD family transcriptional regulator [candidate division CSSED10-310 bacterium]
MFKVGELLVYPTQGLAEVQGIETRNVGAQSVEFYILRIVSKNLAIMVPVANETRIGLRKVVAQDQLLEVIDILRAPSDHHYSQWHHRYTDNFEKLKSGSISRTAEVVRDLYWLKQRKNLAIKESRMMDTALQLLTAEIAASKAIPEQEATHIIQNALDHPASTC